MSRAERAGKARDQPWQDRALANFDFALGRARRPRRRGQRFAGQIASDLHDNAVKGRLTWLF